MCGLLGYISKTNIDEINFKFSLDSLSRRGPDNYGVKKIRNDNFNVLFGHRRLKIIDLSDNANQPFTDESGRYSIIFNGEIYNYQSMRKDLENKGYRFKTKSDTEVLLIGFIEFGIKIVNYIEGMYSFAIIDLNKNRVTLARDHFGKKPLYYFYNDKCFVFASEIKAILKIKGLDDVDEVNMLSVSKFLFYGYVPSPNSIFSNIKKLEPSTIIQFSISKWQIDYKEKYWKLANTSLKKISEKRALEKLDFFLTEAVKKRLISDVPLGVFLSGGIDSSLISAIMKKFSYDVNSYTVSYSDYSEEDTRYSKIVSAFLGINSKYKYFEGSKVKDNFLEILNYIDEPMADAAILPLYYISKFAKEEITVALSGDGGDEVFGGYQKYKVQSIVERIKYLKYLTNILNCFVKPKSNYKKLLEGFNMPFHIRQFVFGSGSFLPDELDMLLNKNIYKLDNVFEEAEKYSSLFNQIDTINKSMYLDCKIQLPDWYLVKSDRASMATSLEVRNPLLDKKLVEFVFSLGGNFKIRNGEYKYLLKKFSEKYLPKEVIYRNKKGFGVPLTKWIINDFNDLMKDYLFINNGIFKNDYIEKLFKEHCAQKIDHSFKLLRIFNFNYWFKNYAK